MKKFIYLGFAGLLGLASCADDSYVGGQNAINQNENDGKIGFSLNLPGNTRAEHVGADAASMLNKKFIVGGFKGTKSTDGIATTEVFDDFIVTWKENTAGTTASNTSDWDYVGITAIAPSSVAGNTQAIKYWDYATGQYDFIAYSTGTATAVTTAPSAGQVQVTPITANKDASYTIKGSKDDLAKCYISNMVTAYNPAETSKPKYQDEVKLVFRNLACKARVALYETVPGYSVKNVKFYSNGTRTLAEGADQTNATLYTTGSETYNKFYTAGTATVMFPTIGTANLTESDYNKAHVAITASSSATTQAFGTLNYPEAKVNEKTGTAFLGRTSSDPSFAGTSPYWQTVLPNEDGTALTLRVDYTLEAIDGTGEEITIHGAKAVVPAIYAAWKSNYAYTYIFKISDKTNGWTSTNTGDPEGLYPITFDAVVLDAIDGAEQTTITTVETPSITTYQKGHLYTDGNEYTEDKGDIYVQVYGDELKSDLATKGKLYSVNKSDATEAEIFNALNLLAINQSAADIVGRNGIELTEATSDATIEAIPGVDDNDIDVFAGTAASFTPVAGTIYAYVYEITAPTSSETITTAIAITSGFDFDGAKTTNENDLYYLEEDCSGTPVTGSASADGIYYQTYTKNNGKYAVKVIKVIS